MQFLRADQPGCITVVLVNIGHLAENVFLMPGSSQIDDPSALITDILEL